MYKILAGWYFSQSNIEIDLSRYVECSFRFENNGTLASCWLNGKLSKHISESKNYSCFLSIWDREIESNTCTEGGAMLK